MNTAEMWLAAQVDGRVYKCPKEKMLYSKKFGLINGGICNDIIDLDEFDCSFNQLMSYVWYVADEFITIEEAEQRLGVKIIR